MKLLLEVLEQLSESEKMILILGFLRLKKMKKGCNRKVNANNY